MRTEPLAALLLVGIALAPGGVRAQSAEQGAALARALGEARSGDWDGATAAAQSAGTVAAEIVTWLRLRDGTGDWPDYTAFLARNPDWPAAASLRRQAETRMPKGLPPAEVIGFFAASPPQTGTGALRLAQAQAAVGHEAAAQQAIARAWTELSLTGAEAEAIQRDWPDVAARLDRRRLDMLLWRGLTSEAEAMLPSVDADTAALAKARIAVRRDADGTTAMIAALPPRLQQDPGLVYERYLYRLRQGHWEDAEAWMLRASSSAETLGRPEIWMEKRADLAREALSRGDVETAYGLAAKGYGTAGSDTADAEWLAGFIALTRMDDPRRAADHFRRFRSLVFTPISLGRAGYWLGLAEERAGHADAAEAAFREAATQQTSFYGQLAAERAGQELDARLVGDAPVPDWRTEGFMARPVVQAGTLLLRAGEDGRASLFFRQAASGQPASARAALAQMAIDLGAPQIGIRIAKDAAGEGLVLPRQYYPLNEIAGQRWPVPTELALAIARQESELDPTAASDAGAKGLMQLMPATARSVALEEGIPFDPDRLGRDPLYNARLGTGYLERMLERYGGSALLAAAAYNAGPNRADAWLASLGDPRKDGADPAVWIESIPFKETRNYVMRVLEGIQVYRVRLKGQPAPVELAADIRGTG
ncbi:MAG: lytic transglycosylase domain-containing protein [Amaricoccus sp.]